MMVEWCFATVAALSRRLPYGLLEDVLLRSRFSYVRGATEPGTTRSCHVDHSLHANNEGCPNAQNLLPRIPNFLKTYFRGAKTFCV